MIGSLSYWLRVGSLGLADLVALFLRDFDAQVLQTMSIRYPRHILTIIQERMENDLCLKDSLTYEFHFALIRISLLLPIHLLPLTFD